jgi:superfamily II RNA helicase
MQTHQTQFIEQLGFSPDTFQLEALSALSASQSLVVCSPTGSGKTLIAEFAAYQAVKQGKKIFYTTPLKALSNQKYFDFCKVYGEDNVGLLTGDMSINREAAILVMTTEVFRNMLYGIQEDARLVYKVSAVVLDECHYMNDADRGTVWEESIIYCPKNIQIIALSATIANAQELTDWINDVHGNTTLVHSNFRPVPLRFFYYNRQDLLPLFNHGSSELNAKLKFESRDRKLPKNLRELDPKQLITLLHEKEMLPAIFFVFSRKGCDKALRETRNLSLLSPEEREQIHHTIETHLQQHPYLKASPAIAALRNGFASHHAGLLPALKSLVEALFQRGLIKMVFATETLAAGINMPARTTIIASISKRTQDGHRLLTASEFLQMSGRAGRRGMDSVGYVVTISSPYESAQDMAHLASSQAEPLNSQFTSTYSMVLNLLEKKSLDDAAYLISKSFGAYTAHRTLKPLKTELDDNQAALKILEEFECPYHLDEKTFQGYLKNKTILKEAYKTLKLYKVQVKKFGNSPELQQAINKEEGKKRSLEAATQNLACKHCKIYTQHFNLGERLRRVRKHTVGLQKQFDLQVDQYWRAFETQYQLLKELGHFSAQDQPTESGKIIAAIRAENELFIGHVVLEGFLEELRPAQLAGVLSALMNDSNKDNVFSKMRIHPDTRSVLYEIEKLAGRLYNRQQHYRIETPFVINPVASGLVEAWVDGCTWQAMIDATSLDEGDMVRLLRRTADMLRQISHLEGVPYSVNDAARVALANVLRDPIKDEAIVIASEDPEASEEGSSEIDLP